MTRTRAFEGIDWSNGSDRGYHVVTIGPDATPEDVRAFRDAYDLGCAWAEAEAALPGQAPRLTCLAPLLATGQQMLGMQPPHLRIGGRMQKHSAPPPPPPSAPSPSGCARGRHERPALRPQTGQEIVYCARG